MRILILLIPALLLAQQGHIGVTGHPGKDGLPAESPKLTADQKDSLKDAMLAHQEALTALYRLDSDYMEMRKDAVKAAERAGAAMGEVVKKLAAIAPNCQLTKAGEFDKCTPKPEPKPAK